MRKFNLLLVDHSAERPEYQVLREKLADVEIVGAVSTEQASELLAKGSFGLLVVVHDPPRIDGLELLRSRQGDRRAIPAIVAARQPSLQTAQECIRLGVNELLVEPISSTELGEAVERLLNETPLIAPAVLRGATERSYGFDEFIGASPPMRKVFETIEQIADLDVDVLVHGETGTGKELVARSIHRRSRRAEHPFVPVDCGAIPENLLESEFFGHERGAFTGADMRRVGLLEFAHRGTFFLDELGELPQNLQAKLLRTLQERKIRRIGGREEISVDLRVVAATSRNLEEMIRQGLFREDLYYRINVVRIELPPLRERGDDIGLLAERLVIRYGKEMNKRVTGITPEAFQVLRQYNWPGNVRELQNVLRRSIALAKEHLIGLNDLPDALIISAGERGSEGPAGFFQLRDIEVSRFERLYLASLLKRHRGNVKTAAAEAKVPRGTLYRLMKNHDLVNSDFR